jgi:hypothetical protein
MLDPLLCCYLIAAVKLVGCFIDFAGLLQWARAQGRVMRALAMPNRTAGVAAAREPWPPRLGPAPAIFRGQDELAEYVAQYFAQNLARLESYVASMA